jgi:hypothetical protein
MAFARRRLAIFAVVALVAFAVAFAEAAFVHTDDGCRVETHCLSCRWTVGTAGTAPPPVFALAPALVRAGSPSELPDRGIPEASVETPTSRGPPAQA